MSGIQVSASILAADPLSLREEVASVIAAGADRLHVDIMDGHYVPNMTFGPETVLAIKNSASVPVDVHLMVTSADPFIEMFSKCADTLIIHPETTHHIHRSLTRIKELGIKAGVALNPGTPIELLTPVLPLVDHILVMSVNPGFGGQAFIQSSLNKLSTLHSIIQKSGLPIELSVDGGINEGTAPKVIKAGASVLVAGNAIFKATHYNHAISTLKSQK